MLAMCQELYTFSLFFHSGS